MNKPKKGGARPGAGRHTLHGSKMKPTTIRIPASHLETLSKVNLNISAAVRDLIEDPIVAKRIKTLIDEKESKP